MSEAWFIYHILDKRGQVAYIGIAKNPYKRMLSHISEANRLFYVSYCHTKFYRWMRRELSRGRLPQVVPVQRFESRKEASTAESLALIAAKRDGIPIKNSNFRGSGGDFPPPHVRWARDSRLSREYKKNPDRLVRYEKIPPLKCVSVLFVRGSKVKTIIPPWGEVIQEGVRA